MTQRILVAAKFKGMDVPAFGDRFEKHDIWNTILDHFGVEDKYLFNPSDLPLTIASYSTDTETWGNEAYFNGKRFPFLWPRRIFNKAIEGEIITIKMVKGEDLQLQMANTLYDQVIPKSGLRMMFEQYHDLGDDLTYKDVPFQDVFRFINLKKRKTIKQMKERNYGTSR